MIFHHIEEGSCFGAQKGSSPQEMEGDPPSTGQIESDILFGVADGYTSFVQYTRVRRSLSLDLLSGLDAIKKMVYLWCKPIMPMHASSTKTSEKTRLAFRFCYGLAWCYFYCNTGGQVSPWRKPTFRKEMNLVYGFSTEWFLCPQIYHLKYLPDIKICLVQEMVTL